MFNFKSSFGVALLVVAFGCVVATAQTEFAQQVTDWNELESQMKEVEAQFNATSDVDEQAKLKKDYQSLLDEASAMIEDLKSTGMAALDSDPSDKMVIRTMMGIAMNDADSGDDASALRIGHKLIDGGIDRKYFELAANADRLSIAGREVFEELLIRHREAEVDDLPRVRITTNKGEIVVELFENESPDTVGNFVSLVESEFYNGLKFHRVMADFMAQAGDPNGDGSGGPGYNIYCECNSPEARRHFTGTLSMAKQPARDTGGSQFFLTYRRTSQLDGKHTVFGRIVSGQDVLNKITKTYDGSNTPYPNVTADVMEKVEVIRKRDHEYKPNKVSSGEEEDDPAPKAQPDVLSEDEKSDDGNGEGGE